ncbi:MAG: helix-turn-helix domain-containing protein [Dehalococcoidia bacterium]
MTTAQTFSIGALAARSGCKVPTIRYYEGIGLLPESPRTEGGHRQYGDEAVKRLVFVRRSRKLGFTLQEVQSLLELSSDGARACVEVDAIASHHLSEVEHKIQSLTAMRDALSDLIEQCQRTTILECRVIDALSTVVATSEPSVRDAPLR